MLNLCRLWIILDYHGKLTRFWDTDKQGYITNPCCEDGERVLAN